MWIPERILPRTPRQLGIMSAKYSRLPTDETAIDFSSIFSSELQKPPKYFSYSVKPSEYKSIFTYSNSGDDDDDSPPVPYESPGFLPQCIAGMITFICYVMVFLTFPLNFWFTLKKVKDNNTLVIYRLGRLLGPKKPGYVVLLPCLDKWTLVDVGMKAFSVPPQKIITSDGAIVETGGDVYYQVSDAALCTSGVVDLQSSLRTLCLTVLKNHISKCELYTITHQKYVVITAVQDDINKATTKWGVTISKVELAAVKVLDENNSGIRVAGLGQINPVNILTSLLPTGLSPSPQNFYPVPGVPFPGMPAASTPTAPLQPLPNEQLVKLIKEGSPADLQSVIDKVESLITPDLMQECNAVYKFVISGSAGRTYFMDLKNGTGSCGIGDPKHPPNVTITVSAEDAIQIYRGEMSVMNAYFSGGLLVDGYLQAAKRLRALTELMPQ